MQIITGFLHYILGRRYKMSLFQCLIQAGSNNPVILLDEIDKLTRDFRGDPASALLEVDNLFSLIRF